MEVMYHFFGVKVDGMYLPVQQDILVCQFLVVEVSCVIYISSAFVRPLAAAVIIWSLVSVGVRRLCGNHFTSSHMRVDAVTGVQILLQR